MHRSHPGEVVEGGVRIIQTLRTQSTLRKLKHKGNKGLIEREEEEILLKRKAEEAFRFFL
jgi:hypothetical protein